jgi:uncharacterized peroxidase-related enzyme
VSQTSKIAAKKRAMPTKRSGSSATAGQQQRADARLHANRRKEGTGLTPAWARCGSEDDVKITALALPPDRLSPAMEAYFNKCEERLGFVPNVLKALAFDSGKLEAFVEYRQRLVQEAETLSKLEIEMIATAVSAQNRCFYCITAHGNAVRQLGDPVLGEMMVQNYRAARLPRRQRAMLDFAVKLTRTPWEIEEEDRDKLRRAGFTDRDIWDIAAVAAFYNMTNRLASASDMQPNSVYHGQAR